MERQKNVHDRDNDDERVFRVEKMMREHRAEADAVRTHTATSPNAIKQAKLALLDLERGRRMKRA